MSGIPQLSDGDCIGKLNQKICTAVHLKRNSRDYVEKYKEALYDPRSINCFCLQVQREQLTL